MLVKPCKKINNERYKMATQFMKGNFLPYCEMNLTRDVWHNNKHTFLVPEETPIGNHEICISDIILFCPTGFSITRCSTNCK